MKTLKVIRDDTITYIDMEKVTDMFLTNESFTISWGRTTLTRFSYNVEKRKKLEEHIDNILADLAKETDNMYCYYLNTKEFE